MENSNPETYQDLLNRGKLIYPGVRIGRPGRARTYWVTIFLMRVLNFRWSVKVSGAQHVKRGPAILVGNHVDAMDPVAIVMKQWWRVTAFAKVEVFESRGPAGALLFAFAGNLGTAQGLSAWLLAIQASQDLTDLYFVFLGEGAEKSQLQSKADLLGLKRTFFIDPVELSEYVHLAAEIDAQIISLTNSPLFHMTIPGKLQSCLALGKAIVASVAGDSARIIVDSGAGLVAAPGNSAEIEKIIRLAHREGQAALAARGSLGRSYYLDHMGSRTSSALLVDVLRSAAISGLKGPR